MKFKELLLACVTLTVSLGIKADFKTRFAEAKTFVQENPYQVAKIGISGHALAFSIFTLCDGIKFLYTCTYERTKSNYLRLFSIPTTIVASYYMLNDGLNNKPNETIKSLMQKAKQQLSKSSVNEHK